MGLWHGPVPHASWHRPGDVERPRTLSELARSANLSKTTAFRYLTTLAHQRYVLCVERRRYVLGPAAFALADAGARDAAVRAVAHPAMERLAARFGETVNLAVPRGKRMHYLEIVEPNGPIELRAEPGDADCLHCTALGKALLAYMNRGERERHLNVRMPRLTANTITDRRSLERSLSTVRRFGFAIEREENEVGCAWFAASIFSGDDPVAAISLSVPVDRLTVAPTSRCPTP